MGKFTPDGYGYDVSEHRNCPYKEGLKCFLADCEDCPIHPDYESEEDIEAFDSVYDEGWQQGFKKGYIQAMEDEDAWVDEDEEDFKPLTWEIEEPHTPYTSQGCPCGLDCCEFNDYNLDASDCEGCEFNLGDLEDLYQSGELEPDIAKAYEIGKYNGYEQGLADISIASEENYIEGYKDCFLGEEPCIYDEDLEELLEQECSFEDYEEKMPFVVDTEIIDDIESLKKEIVDIKRNLNEDISMIPVVNKRLFDLLHKLTVIQEQVTTNELYHYLGYK